MEIKSRKEDNEVNIKILEEANNKAENEKLAKKKILEKQERSL